MSVAQPEGWATSSLSSLRKPMLAAILLPIAWSSEAPEINPSLDAPLALQIVRYGKLELTTSRSLLLDGGEDDDVVDSEEDNEPFVVAALEVDEMGDVDGDAE